MSADVQSQSTDAGCSVDAADGDGCSLWKIFSLCRYRSKRRIGSEASLVKSDSPSSSSSLAASKRTLASQDGIVPTDNGPLSSATTVIAGNDLEPAHVRSPSYLKVSRCVSGYSTFTSYASDRQLHRTAVPDAVNGHLPTPNGDRWAESRTTEVLKGGQQCCVKMVDDVIADVTTVGNGGLHQGCECVHRNAGSGVQAGVEDDRGAINKDGAYFQRLMETERRRLQQICNRSERHLAESDEPVPDEVQGKIRAAIGKANLLTTKKFRQFQQLCTDNLNQTQDEPFQTTNTDLAGFWDLIQLQITDVDRQFDELEELWRHNWQLPPSSHPQDFISASSDHNASENQICSSSVVSSSSGTINATPASVRRQQQQQRTLSSPARPRPSPSSSTKSRDEARQRLMAAKLAARQRNQSVDSDKRTTNNVEFFIS